MKVWYKYSMILTYDLGWFILTLVDEMLKGLFHYIDEFLVLVKTCEDNIFDFVLKICRKNPVALF